MTARKWISFNPEFVCGDDVTQLLASVARQLAEVLDRVEVDRQPDQMEAIRRGGFQLTQDCQMEDQQAFIAAINVLVDLLRQGWLMQIKDCEIKIARPTKSKGAEERRKQIRTQLQSERNEQLRKPSVRLFVKSMETKRLHGDRIVSVFNLMRDGRELSDRLKAVRQSKDVDGKIDLLQGTVRPYLQFVVGDECCELTGFRLIDIWRYFRLTWANPYKSVPGRTMMVLVRDAAEPFHPVMGIAALSSAPVGLSVRDNRIGWTSEVVLERIKHKPSKKWANWLHRTVDEAIDEIYKDDLIADGAISLKDLKHPSEVVINNLREASHLHREEHYRLMQGEEYKISVTQAKSSEHWWAEQARTPLFRGKRELELSDLLKVRSTLNNLLPKPSISQLKGFMATSPGRDAIRRLVRRAKGVRVGTVMAELSICGAVPPYGELLGAKLVAVLATSPEVVREYRKRYGGTESVIASSMAGRSIIRPAELVFIGTTSLYGIRPCQYDRISIGCNRINESLPGRIHYEYLGKTQGYGTFQFGEKTVKELSKFLSQTRNGRKAHNVFGEGASPRLRNIRDGLDKLGLSSDDLLDHGAPRLIYGSMLVSNANDYLLGLDKTPKYLIPPSRVKEASVCIGRWWLERWVLNRISKKGLLKQIASHSLIHPIEYGARVKLPREDSGQGVLFDY